MEGVGEPLDDIEGCLKKDDVIYEESQEESVTWFLDSTKRV